MDRKIDDGGPAFPSEQGHADGCWNQTLERGMSLRDWIAGKALVGLLARGADDDPSVNVPVRAYAIADAMIASRKGVA